MSELLEPLYNELRQYVLISRKTHGDDTLHFDDIDSQRVRLDAGLSHQYTESVAVRTGLEYEYEFDGKANAMTYGYDIAAPSVQGSIVVLSLGSTLKPLATQPLSVDINLNGYTGKRQSEVQLCLLISLLT